MSSPARSVEPLLPLPDFTEPQRARIVLDFWEEGVHIHEAERGWAMIDGPWVHWRSDIDAEDRSWHSWPQAAVVVIDWLSEEEEHDA